MVCEVCISETIQEKTEKKIRMEFIPIVLKVERYNCFDEDFLFMIFVIALKFLERLFLSVFTKAFNVSKNIF